MMTAEDHDLLVRIDERQRKIEKELNALRQDMDQVKAQANRWKGAFVVVLGLGGLAGFVIDRMFAKLWP